jgi:hypothetical protein
VSGHRYAESLTAKVARPETVDPEPDAPPEQNDYREAN